MSLYVCLKPSSVISNSCDGELLVLRYLGWKKAGHILYVERMQGPHRRGDKGQFMGVDTSNVLIANSGNDLPVIDLTRVSQELAYLASDADLVVLEGMGRGIETNLYAQFKCNSMKIGMVHDKNTLHMLLKESAGIRKEDINVETKQMVAGDESVLLDGERSHFVDAAKPTITGR